MDFLVVQFLNGLASASSLFLIASGLSIIFGVTRIVNFAHGSFYMIGAYVAYSATGVVGFWPALLVAAVVVAVLGAAVEMTVLRRIYRAPEMFQLLATFGIVLIVEDAVLMIWGAEDLLGPRAPGLAGAVNILGQPFPQYELALIFVGPAVLAGLWLLFNRTRWGVLVRAATQDREMVAALGINQSWLFTSVFFLGALLAGLGGAMQLPREAVHHAMDLQIIVEAFVVVVIGGLGSVPGAFLAAVIISELNAFGILIFPGITLVLVFLVMAVVLVVRPWGLMGRPEAASTGNASALEPPLTPLTRAQGRIVMALLALLVLLPFAAGDYVSAVAAEIIIFSLFAASLHLVMGTGGMISFGHAAYFGLGAYGAALMVRHLSMPMELALIGGPLLAGLGGLAFGWFCVRLTGVYLAMLSLAFAQITWSVVFQWYGFTGGDNGILGVWPSAWAAGSGAFYILALVICAVSLFLIRRFTFAPFGYTLRACRDSALRAAAIGIHVHRQRWLGFALGGFFAGIAGSLYAFLKGSVFPDSLSVPVSVDGLVMVLLGGVHSLFGPLVGAVTYKTLHIVMSSATDYWRLVLGVIIVVLVVAFPEGITGFVRRRFVPAAGKLSPPAGQI